jgi:tRNA-specific 2-thiouridylase
MLQKDHSVQGFFMHLAQPDFARQRARVQIIADRLGINLAVIDLRHQFSEKVLDYFAASYCDGLTPNPCLVCNREIKFGLFLKAILAAGMDLMATGHYARIIEREGLYHLHKGCDLMKDQSYFLSRLGQEQLRRLIFPLGEKSKTETYAFVKEHDFNNFDGLESQDVCFLEGESVGDYLEKTLSHLPSDGPIVTVEGRELGRHHGLFRYTVGQRKGLGIPDSSPWYVVAIDPRNNKVVVGKDDQLMRRRVEIANLHWLAGIPPADGSRHEVRLRSTHRGATAVYSSAANGRATLLFDNPQRAVTPGQFAVLYRGDEVLGSGVIG